MKRILVSLAALAACLLSGAQTRIPLLDRVPGHRVSCNYTYSVSRDGEPFSEVTSGKLEVEDNAFRLEGLGLRIVSDGSVRWTLDDEAREAVVEAVLQDDITVNPALLINDYTSYGNQITVNDSGKDFLDVTLELDSTTSARFLLKDIVYGDRQGKSDFSIDGKSLPKDFVITDLR